MKNIEHVILRNLLFDENYSRRVLPYLKNEYFTNKSDKILFDNIQEFITNYNSLPTTEALEISLDSQSMSDDVSTEIKKNLKEFSEDKENSTDKMWIIDKTEQFCQEKAIYLAVLKSIEILDNKKGTEDKGAIPHILSEALGVSFDSYIGHDYLDNAQERYEFYHQKHKRIPFDLEYFNLITGGGVIPKTLNLVIGQCVHPDTKINVRIRKR